jgi:hypothetical protein
LCFIKFTQEDRKIEYPARIGMIKCSHKFDVLNWYIFMGDQNLENKKKNFIMNYLCLNLFINLSLNNFYIVAYTKKKKN